MNVRSKSSRFSEANSGVKKIEEMRGWEASCFYKLDREASRSEGVLYTRIWQVESRASTEVLSGAWASLDVQGMVQASCLEQSWERACKGSKQRD